MKKKWFKKGLAIALSVTMVLGIMPSVGNGFTEVKAATNTEPTTSEYVTKDQLLTVFDLDSDDSDGASMVGKIKFGADDRTWLIAGADGTDTLALLSSTQFGISVYGSESLYGDDTDSNKTSTVLSYLNNCMSDTTYFSDMEKDLMRSTAVKTTDYNGIERTVTGKLYLPDAENRNSYGAATIYVGSNNNIPISVTNMVTNGGTSSIFWLRSPSACYNANAFTVGSGKVESYSVNSVFIAVVPALDLNLSSVIFASAAPAATSASSLTLADKTYVLRYDATGSAIADSTVQINPEKTAVKLSGIPASGAYLVVQNSDGATAVALTDTTTSIQASDITIGSPLTSFDNCKVWIETTEDNLTYAKEATQLLLIGTTEVTDITAPSADEELDSIAACTSTGVASVSDVTYTLDAVTVSGTAGYAKTYTASVTLTSAAGYCFDTSSTATMNNEPAKVILNADGTLTVSYSFPRTLSSLSDAQYVTKDDLMECFGLNTGDTVGKIKFGAGDRTWLIAGADGTDTLALLSASSFETSAYGRESIYGDDIDSTRTSTVLSFLNNCMSDTKYFSDIEKDLMRSTAVKTTDYNGIERTVTGKLYLPDAANRFSYGASTIYVGANNNIPISVTDLVTNGGASSDFWLRSPSYSSDIYALIVHCGSVNSYGGRIYLAVVPALDLNLSSVIFASAAPAATSASSLTMAYKTYVLRYDATGSAIADSTGQINPAKTAVKLSGIPASGAYLVVQNSDGAVAVALTDATTSIKASDITIGSPLTSFDNCKVWIETTEDNLTYAKSATQRTGYNVEVTNPSESHITLGSASVNGAASQTDITGAMADVVYTADDGYYFPSDYSVASVNGVSVTRDSSTQITVSGTPADDTNITLIAATARIYTISVNTETKNFGTQNAGYTQPAAETITVTNTGNSTVILTQPTATGYDIETLSKASLNVGETATFTVQPKASLTAGTYDETISVNTDHNTSASVDVSFKVNGAFTATITPDSASITDGDSQTLEAMPAGGSGTYTYKWYKGSETDVFASSKSVTVTPTKTTTYKVVINDTIENKEVTATVTVTPKPVVAAPAANPSAGIYTVDQSITLSSTTVGAKIYYTTDGTIPCALNGTEYNSAIEVTGMEGQSKTTTINAIAIKDGMQDSAVETFEYIINIPAPTYAVTVTNGTTDQADCTAGTEVTITAGTAPEGQQFKNWTVESGNVILADASSATTTFTMPAGNVTVKAVFENKASEDPSDNETDYKIIDGVNSTWTAGTDGTLTIRGEGELSKFISVKVDGMVVDSSNYTTISGSTIITFNKSYLDTLSKGSHTFEMEWTDGTASTTFTVKEATAKDDKDTDLPQTGDNSPILLWILVLLASGVGVGIIELRKEKRRRKDV